MDLVEWQTLLLLPGFCESIIVPRHLVEAIVDGVTMTRDNSDFRGICRCTL